MKTLIIGTGVIGTIYGWALSAAGVDITHLVRKDRKQSYADGIDLDIYDIRDKKSIVTISQDLSRSTTEGCSEPEPYATKYYPRLVENAAEGGDYELIMLPTRHYQLVEAVKALEEKKASGTYLFFTNNWEGTAEIDRIVPRSRYLWGYAGSVGGFINNRMILNVGRNYRIGLLEGNDIKKYQAVIDLFKKTGFEPDVQRNMIHWLWLHHAQIAAQIGSFIYFGGAKETLASLENCKLMCRAVREAFAIVQAKGVNLGDYQTDTALYLNCEVKEVGKKLYAYLRTKWGQRSSEQSHLNTNQQDLKIIFQDVYNTGKKLKLNMPCFDKLQFKLKCD